MSPEGTSPEQVSEGEMKEATTLSNSSWNNYSWRGCFLVMGIFSCLLMYGYAQEKIMTQSWGEGNSTFNHSVFLVMCNRITSMSIAIIVMLGRRESFAPCAPLSSYLAVSLSNMLATTCQYEALRYVSFPTQTLGKSAKMIPVMLWGAFLSKKIYSLKDYSCALCISSGCALFLLTGDVGAPTQEKKDKDTTLMGLITMIMYLFFDGFTSTWQERLFKKSNVSTWNQMLYVGLISAIITGSGQISTFSRVPTIETPLRNLIILLSMSAAFGQIFILFTIREFGALVLSMVMTTRQFFSILLSCLIFLHPLSAGQILGTCLVFGSLYYKSLADDSSRRKKKDPAQSGSTEGKSLPENNDTPEGIKMMPLTGISVDKVLSSGSVDDSDQHTNGHRK